ncbi:patatin-like phospholipase family protein [Brooklawnia cerclae]|uniref:NTE family protein n=1 Tax=Brooklawnia cerclae TaxID=349934 RepID=A0ABX0SLY5_9ACTN|nr:patatin-like phospholipase family protein [Brooklawnia cerclae]NIH57761.1 NTE family protein [Brooklawnia cerclae]
MRISLVLGSGGARGYAHVGAIRELEARGHEIVAVAGASIGALVGGALAAGKLDELADAALHLSRTDVWMMFRPSLNQAGLIKPDRVMNALRRIIGDVRIEDLPVPYTAVATDLLSRREVWFHEGPLLAAIRASISIPSVFTPVMLQGRLLTDGGLVNPLPMETSLRLDADVTVAVSLFGPDPGLGAAGAIEVSSDKHDTTNPLTRLSERIAGALPTIPALSHAGPEQDDPFDPLPPDLDIGDMVVMSLNVMQARIQASRIAVNPPDVHIEVPVSLASTFDFGDAERIIETGRELAAAEFDRVGL